MSMQDVNIRGSWVKVVRGNTLHCHGTFSANLKMIPKPKVYLKKKKTKQKSAWISGNLRTWDQICLPRSMWSVRSLLAGNGSWLQVSLDLSPSKVCGEISSYPWLKAALTNVGHCHCTETPRKNPGDWFSLHSCAMYTCCLYVYISIMKDKNCVILRVIQV